MLLLNSCKKELDYYEQSRLYCKDGMQFNCTGPLNSHYFKGELNGTEFCVSDSASGYRALNGVGTETITSADDPRLLPGAIPTSSFYRISFNPPIKYKQIGIAEDFVPYVYIETPYINDTMVLKASEYIEKFYHAGDLPIRDNAKDKYSGFNFVITWGCVMLPGYQYYHDKNPYQIPSVGELLTPANGKQDNFVFKITELKKTVYQDIITYDITFQISCTLYYGNQKANDNYFGRLEDGIFKTQIILPKDG